MPKANIMMLGRTPLQHVVHHLKLVKSVRMNEALLVMPLAVVEILFRFVNVRCCWVVVVGLIDCGGECSLLFLFLCSFFMCDRK